MVFVLYFFRIFQVQAGVAQSLQYAGRRIAAEYCTDNENIEKSNTESGVQDDEVNLGEAAVLLKARIFFQQELKKQNCPLQYIQGEMSGISF